MPSSALQGYTENRDFIRNVPRFLPKAISFINRDLHKSCHLKAILIVTRCSSGVQDAKLIPQYQKNNDRLVLKYVSEHRVVHVCKCRPTVEQFFLNDFPSNTNLITTKSAAIADIRLALHTLERDQTKGIIAIIISQDDGFTTHVASFAEFFRHYVPQLNLLLTILKTPAAVEMPIHGYIEAIKECFDGNYKPQNPYHHQVMKWAEIALNKQILSAAAVANALASLKKRNSGSDGSYYLTQEEALGESSLPSDALIRLESKSFNKAISRRKAKTVVIPQSLPNQMSCGITLQKKLAKIEPIDGKKQCTTLKSKPRSGRIQVPQFELPRSADDTCFTCTEAPDCEMTFHTVEALFEHMTEVMVSLPSKERYCWLCGESQCERINRGTWNEHFQRHFASRFRCNGCGHEFRVEDDLKRHFNAFPATCGTNRDEQLPGSSYNPTRTMKKQTNHAYECDICFKSFKRVDECRNHKRTAHLPRGGILSFARLVKLPVDAALGIFPFLDDENLEKEEQKLAEARNAKVDTD